MRAVITAWSAISAGGSGRAALDAARARPTLLDEQQPDLRALVAEQFVVEEALGKKGTGSMDRSSALAVAVARDVLATVEVDELTGVVLGTTSGSTQTQWQFTRDSLTRRKPYFVNPAMMPFALMNSAASQVAIWHGLKGPNATIADGRLSGLSGLRYAMRLLAVGRASGVVCGAVEECSVPRAWLEQHRGGDRLPGEGAAVVFLEPPGSARRPLAEVLGVQTKVAVSGDLAATLAGCVRSVLTRFGYAAGEVNTIAVSAPGGWLAEAERAGVAEALGSAPVKVLDPGQQLGDLGAAIGPFQFVALLAEPGLGLATALDEDGTVGCGLLRVS